ncbi:hypothetical protein HP550_15795 [Cellulomonas humilata]|uniref:Uncharacterized protein n=1 Tax=Cellulomonas humilata TaxID=144055 RepID=A0A7Y6A2W4_9CELL|nr:hypothetical protein [Cellulomonas humilata]NUU18717.1 hypothetical protein [Cellulomonas humilata]
MTFTADRPPEDVLADALDARYAYASPYDLADAWDGMLESVTPAEALSLSRAARTIGRGASTLARDPALATVLSTAAPVVGTAVGGPIGGALGAKLGSVAAARLAPAAAPVSPGPTSTVAGTTGLSAGSTAAAQLLVLLGQPDVQRALLRLALGEHGKRTPVNGVAVPELTRALSTIAAQAAQDADDLCPADEHDPADDAEDAPDPDTVYRTVIDALDAELAEAVR